MPTLRILSGGAAQGLMKSLKARFEAETGCTIEGEFGAVGMMVEKLRSGTPADLLILTSRLIRELAKEGYVEEQSAKDVGIVQTAVATRAGDPMILVGSGDQLKAALLAADEIYIPDPEQATAGIHFASVLKTLGIWEEAAGRLRPFPNGATAMRAMAASKGAHPIGCTQITEILNTRGVSVLGLLPPGYELATVYTAAICAKAESPDLAQVLMTLLSSQEALERRRLAGFT
jgi:molybdate transport system substrate-binding protein